VKKMLRNSLCGLGLVLLVVAAAVAQESYVKHGVAGVRGLTTHAVLPPAAIFTNCGTGCTSYAAYDGYFVSGTSGAYSPGQTLAIGFSSTKTTKFTDALTPNSNYTGVKGGKIAAYLLNGTATGGPTTEVAALSYRGSIPDTPTVRVVKYTSKKKITFKKGVEYFLCETDPAATTVMLWMLSNSDFSSPVWYQDDGSCAKKGMTWLDDTGNNAMAAEIN
jgi:hypothetical protein